MRRIEIKKTLEIKKMNLRRRSSSFSKRWTWEEEGKRNNDGPKKIVRCGVCWEWGNTRCNTLQHTISDNTRCNTLQHTIWDNTRCNTLQHTISDNTRCNTLQNTLSLCTSSSEDSCVDKTSLPTKREITHHSPQRVRYGVATSSRLLKITRLFCRI